MDEPRQHNQRKWDDKLGLVLKVFAVSSALWGLVVFLDSQLITLNEYHKQRNYTDYQVTTLKLNIKDKAIKDLEYKITIGNTLTPREVREYEDLKRELPILKKQLHKLGGTF